MKILILALLTLVAASAWSGSWKYQQEDHNCIMYTHIQERDVEMAFIYLGMKSKLDNIFNGMLPFHQLVWVSFSKNAEPGMNMMLSGGQLEREQLLYKPVQVARRQAGIFMVTPRVQALAQRALLKKETVKLTYYLKNMTEKQTSIPTDNFQQTWKKLNQCIDDKKAATATP